MNASHPALGMLQLFRAARENPRRWAVPAAVVALAALLFAAFRPATWQASQALIIRNEATVGGDEPGRFVQPERMKTVQETILELAKSVGVLRGALVEAGPPADYSRPREAWPSDRDVADLRDVVAINPPKGAEFGMTEVFYLTVKDSDRDRALKLDDAMREQLEKRFQEIRDAKAQSMIDELDNGVKLAQADLAEATARLSEMEKSVGSDLAELRMLNETINGDSTLRRTAGEISTELREARNRYALNRELLALLRQAQGDPGQLLAAPNQLLESQPALRRLKDGLVDAQIQTSQLQGRMSDIHPMVLAARESEKEIGRHLHQELGIAIRGVEADLRLTADRIALLEERQAETAERLSRLAALRAPYANQLADMTHRTQVLQRAEQQLSQARASRASVSTSSLISRIDSPDAGTKPLGPGRAVIALAGLVGGPLVGLGILLLTIPPTGSGPAPSVPAPAAFESASPRRESDVEESCVRPVFAPSLASALKKINGNGKAVCKTSSRLDD